jgi:hypothetical protein
VKNWQDLKSYFFLSIHLWRKKRKAAELLMFRILGQLVVSTKMFLVHPHLLTQDSFPVPLCVLNWRFCSRIFTPFSVLYFFLGIVLYCLFQRSYIPSLVPIIPDFVIVFYGLFYVFETIETLETCFVVLFSCAFRKALDLREIWTYHDKWSRLNSQTWFSCVDLAPKRYHEYIL